MKALVRILAAVSLIAATLVPIPAQALGGGEVAWNIHCGVSHFNKDDPIVSPNLIGAAHNHTFFGNTSTKASTTTDSLLAAQSTCERGFENADHSAYWVPSIFRRTIGGSLSELRGTPEDMSMTIYYRRAGDERVVMIPQGLRMIAGDAKATSDPGDSTARWSCRDIKTGASFGQSGTKIPNCSTNTSLMGFITFPNCWNGTTLDSADHKSHMSYEEQGACPATHPKKIPQLTFEMFYSKATGAGEQYELSSGGQYSLHGDFFAAWDNRVQSALVNGCLNVGKSCTGIQLADVPFAAASKDFPAFASPSATPTAAPSQPPLPIQKEAISLKGPLLPFIAVTIVGILGYLWRRRRALA